MYNWFPKCPNRCLNQNTSFMRAFAQQSRRRSALQPLIWHAESLSSQVSSSPEECPFHRHRHHRCNMGGFPRRSGTRRHSACTCNSTNYLVVYHHRCYHHSCTMGLPRRSRNNTFPKPDSSSYEAPRMSVHRLTPAMVRLQRCTCNYPAAIGFVQKLSVVNCFF